MSGLTEQQAKDLQRIRSSYSPIDFANRVKKLKRPETILEAYGLAKWMEGEGLIKRLSKPEQAYILEIISIGEAVSGHNDLGEGYCNAALSIYDEMAAEMKADGRWRLGGEKVLEDAKEGMRVVMAAARKVKVEDLPRPRNTKDVSNESELVLQLFGPQKPWLEKSITERSTMDWIILAVFTLVVVWFGIGTPKVKAVSAVLKRVQGADDGGQHSS